MQKLKQYMAFLLTVLLVVSGMVTSATAAGGPTIRVSEANAKRGDTVDITVSLENNPGIISMMLSVSYDSNALTLTNVVDANVFGSVGHAPINENNPANPYVLSWENDLARENYSVNGTLATLTFKVKESAASGKHDITVTYGKNGIFDKDLKPVAFTVVNGAVTVEAGAPGTPAIVYNPNTGTGSMNDTTGAQGATVNLRPNAFTKTGYTFSGWNTEPDGTGTSFPDNAPVTMPAGTMTLYAQWTAMKYTVVFDSNGGTTPNPASKTVTYGLAYEDLPTVTRMGYTFAGWFTAPIGGTKVKSITPVGTASTHTLYAQWTTGSNPYFFYDVNTDDWFYDAVIYVVSEGLFNGTGDYMFSPNAPMTRAMIVTVLYRLEGMPAVSGGNPFTDVPYGMWYTDAVVWAARNGIVTGYDARTFGPGDNITREQMAAILYRYARYKGYDTTAPNNLSGFTDAGRVSSWALTAMRWAVYEGLITGVTATRLEPTGNASRAQVATILMRFIEYVAS